MTKRPEDPYNLCTFKFANGKFCTMPAHPKHDGLCLNHATIHRRTFHREDDLVKELASPAGDFITQIDINHVLGKLFEALAANRVSPKRAATLAYIGHLLMQSQHGARREAGNWTIESQVLSKLVDIKYPGQRSSNSTKPAAKSPGPAQPAEAMPFSQRQAIFHFQFSIFAISLLFPLHTRAAPVTPFLPLHTQKQGGIPLWKMSARRHFRFFPYSLQFLALSACEGSWHRHSCLCGVGRHCFRRTARSGCATRR